MKIAFITLDFLPEQIGGGEVYAHNLAKRMQDLGHDVLIVRRIVGASEDYAIENRNFNGLKIFAIKTVASPKSAWVKDQRLYSLARDFFQKNKPDIIHVFLFAGMLSIVEAARDFGISVVMTALEFGMFCAKFQLNRKDGELCNGLMVETKCTECLLESYSPRQRFVFNSTRFLPAALVGKMRDVSNQVVSFDPLLATEIRAKLGALKSNWAKASELIDVVIAPSRVMKRMYVLNGFPQEKIRLSPYGVTGPPQRTVKGPKTDSRVTFGYVGRLHHSKGIDVLINAFKEIKNENVRLVLYGPLPKGEPDGYLRSIMDLAKTDSRIELRGSVTQAEIGIVHENIDVLVVPSTWYENAPLTVLEAFRYGTPVICSDVDGITEFVENGVNGLVFRRNDTESLVAAMLSLVNDKNLLDKLRAETRGLKSVEENADELMDLYSGLIGHHLKVDETTQDIREVR